MSRIKVLVVDDSVVVRRLVTDALSADPAVDVVGVAANGQIALAKVEQHTPDVITMDVEMPVMDGIATVRELRRRGNRAPIIMFSTLTERGAAATLDALSAGASDYVTKPANVGSVQESLARVADDLLPRIKALAVRRTGGPVGTTRRTATSSLPPLARVGSPGPVVLRPRPAPRPVRAVVVGSSTGGPEALATFVRGLTRPLPVPVLAVQHMPPVFTRQLAARLDRLGPSTVVEAHADQQVEAGTIYVAPGDEHMEVAGSPANPHIRLHHGEPVNFCRPAVDVLFRSAVTLYGPDLLAVVLTGMGADGREGSRAVVEAGGTVLAQDETTSVVWGMPGAVAHAGLAHALLPVDEVADAVQRAVAAGAGPAGGTR